MMRKLAIFAVSAAAMAFAGTTARADSFDGPDCTGVYFDRDGQLLDFLIAACSRGRINRQEMTHTEEALTSALARSFNIDTEAQEPGDLDESSEPGEPDAGAVIGKNMLAHPVADAPASASAAKWNTWVDGKYTYDDANQIAFNQDGSLWNGLGGIDYKVTPHFTVGLMGSGEAADLKGPISSLKSNGAGIGPYIGYTLGDHVVLSSSLLGSTIGTRQTDTLNSFHFSSNRVQASAGATGYWYLGGWRVTPGLNFSWSKEWLRENNNLLPDHYVEVAMLTPSFQLGRTVKLSDTATVEPWAGVAYDNSFVNAVKFKGMAVMDEPTQDARVQAGLNFGFGQHTQLSFTGEIGGLINSSVRTYAGEANLAIQF